MTAVENLKSLFLIPNLSFNFKPNYIWRLLLSQWSTIIIINSKEIKNVCMRNSAQSAYSFDRAIYIYR